MESTYSNRDLIRLKSGSAIPSLLDLFDHGMKEGPTSKAAVRFDDGQDMSELSYFDLNEESEVVATHLSVLKVESEIICVSSVKRVSSVSIIIGILKVQAAFSFVDFDETPLEEISQFLKQLGACYIFIWEYELQEITDKGISAEILSKLELLAGTLVLVKVRNIERKKYSYSSWNLAYVIQTSGSTGVPKVVKVTHRCIVPNVIHFRNEYGVTSSDVIYVASPLTFDPCLVDIFLSLSARACALLVPEATKSTPRKLVDILATRNQVTMMQVAPAILRKCGQELLSTSLLGPASSLRILGLGGEACPSKSTLLSWKSPYCRVKMYNVYGITEVSSWATLHRIDFDNETEDIPLGDPIVDTEIRIIDQDGRIVEEKGQGLVFIGGRERICFLDSEDVTVAATCPMRATGDVVRLTTDGNMFYLGRLDDQLKRCGKKISPNRVEKMAKRLSEIEDCQALLDPGKDHLILIIIIRENHRQDTPSIKEKLKQLMVQTLPRHSVPDRIVAITSFPVTAHGKIDKRQLLEIAYLQDEVALNGQIILDKIKKTSSFWSAI